jgi:chemotaxis protein MotA
VLTKVWTGTLLLAVLASIVVQLVAPGSPAVAGAAGFALVACGTLLVARLSHSPAAMRALRGTLRELRTARRSAHDGELQLNAFLSAANFFRYGNIRPAEDAARQIPDPVLRRGTQLVLDGFQRPQLAIALQRQIAEERERLVRPVELLRAMAGYAPSLGMFGTLLGLLQMLFGTGSGDVSHMGAAMGFAMMTTVYGLVLANLFLKPLATKVEQRNRRYLTHSIVAMQAVMLLLERQHPEYIRDVLNNVRVSPAPAYSSFATPGLAH